MAAVPVSKIDLTFITDEGLQETLQSDLTELEAAISNGCHKAALILAGSIAEAILADHLVESGISEPDAAYKMQLAESIAKCRSKGVLSDRTATLCEVIRSYRNLIHPGRVVRTKDSATAESAAVAKSLVSMITREVSETRTRSVGPTAEQIVEKIERDTSVLSILPHLLREMRESQLEKLLLKSLPDKLYLEEILGNGSGNLTERLSRCFRLALELCSVGVRRRVAARFVAIVKKEDEVTARWYSNAFFVSEDLRYVEARSRGIVIDYVLGRFKTDPGPQVLRMIGRIGKYITAEKAPELVTHLVNASRQPNGRVGEDDALVFAWTLAAEVKGKVRAVIYEKLKRYESVLETAKNIDGAELVKAMRTAFDPAMAYS